MAPPLLSLALLSSALPVVGGQIYSYETVLNTCNEPQRLSRQQQWRVVNGRIVHRATDLCLTINSCYTPTFAGEAAVLEHCARGCWAETMVNRVAQQWTVPPAEALPSDAFGRVTSRAALEPADESPVDLCLTFGPQANGLGDPYVNAVPCSNATDWRLVPTTADYAQLQVVFPPGHGNSTAETCPGGPPCCLQSANMHRSAALHAMLAQLLAAAALPLGAVLGVVASPVRSETVAALNAFGAGALLCSLSVQVYNEMIQQIESTPAGSVQVALAFISTILGAVLYNFFGHRLRERVSPFKSAGASAGSLQSEGLRTPLTAEAPRTPGSPLSPPSPADSSVEAADDDVDEEGGDDDDDDEEEEEQERDEAVAAAAPRAVSVLAQERHLAALLWLSVWVDLVPQSILFGVLAGERVLHLSLVLACALANLPQAFSSAALLREHDAASPNVSCTILVGIAQAVSFVSLSNSRARAGDYAGVDAGRDDLRPAGGLQRAPHPRQPSRRRGHDRARLRGVLHLGALRRWAAGAGVCDYAAGGVRAGGQGGCGDGPARAHGFRRECARLPPLLPITLF